MSAKHFQQQAIRALINHFDDIRAEWAVTKGALDGRHFGPAYGPRLDIAVGPFNTMKDDTLIRQGEILACATHSIIKRIVEREPEFTFNPNPRCLLAVEIEFSGSSKHILGDLTNASMMGLVGVVIVPPDNFDKASRIYRYLGFVHNVNKAPEELFRNLVLFRTHEFMRLLA